MRVAVLGSGPSGMMAAWAAKNYGADVQIFSPGKRSVIAGAQYLHKPIPGIDVKKMILTYRKYGTAAGYATKLYGNPDARCSWSEYGAGKHAAYPLATAYAVAWAGLQGSLVTATITPSNLAGLMKNFDLVVSTIPKPSLCIRRHSFTEKFVFITRKTPPELETVTPNTILYNGYEVDPWYRSSNIGGEVSTEYLHEVQGSHRVSKPLENKCNCWAGSGILFAGRYGRWEKGVLVHQAYGEVERALLEMQ